MKTLREELYELMAVTKVQLKKEGSVPNLLLTQAKDGTTIVAPLINDLTPPHTWPDIAKHLSKVSNRIYHTSEAWKRTMTAEEVKEHKRLGRQIMDYEDKSEVLMIEGKERGGELIVLSQDFEHDWDGKIVFKGEVIELNGITSRVLGGVFT